MRVGISRIKRDQDLLKSEAFEVREVIIAIKLGTGEELVKLSGIFLDIKTGQRVWDCNENNSMLQYAAKGKGKATVSYLDTDGREIKAFDSPPGSRGWSTVQIPAARELESDVENISFIEFKFRDDGVIYMDDVEFVNYDPRIYNVILDGGREAGSVLKPVWNTWDKYGRKIYIDEILWYISDAPQGE